MRVEDLCDDLKSAGLLCAYYHAGLTSAQVQSRQRAEA